MFGVMTCIRCGNPFGDHKDDCPVKFRDATNPDPEVQQHHERLDAYYEEQEHWKLGRDPITHEPEWIRVNHPR